MSRRSVVASVLTGATLAGCAGAKPVVVHFSGEPDEAHVTINDRYVDELGRIEERGVALKPGTYRVTVDQVGFFPHDVIVEVKEDAPPPEVEVSLTPIPD